MLAYETHLVQQDIFMPFLKFLEHFFFYKICICCTKSLAGDLVKKLIPLIFLCILFSFLLVFPNQTLEASKSGLLLWFDSLLPTLLPFLIVSQLILKTSLANTIQRFLGPAFRRLFHCSSEGAFCLICGFLCGYPVGARLIALQIKDKRLSLSEGQYLLSFCNNVSPMFCISYGILHAIGSKHSLPYLSIIYGSALIFGLLTRPKQAPVCSIENKKQTSSAENIFQLIDVCIIDSFLILIKLCGYLILFSIITGGILMILSDEFIYTAPAVGAFLEITGGLSMISKLPVGTARQALGVAALTFGGLCCIFQTNSVIAETDLSLKKYIFHKAVTTAIALFLLFLWSFFCRSFSIDCWS